MNMRVAVCLLVASAALLLVGCATPSSNTSEDDRLPEDISQSAEWRAFVGIASRSRFEPFSAPTLAQACKNAVAARPPDIPLAMAYDACIDAAAKMLEPGNFYISDIEARALIGSRPKHEAPVVKRVRADVLLVSIPTFSPSAYAAISSQLRGLALDPRIRNVIIDIRGCSGGVLEDIQEAGSLFMNGGLLGYARGSKDTPVRAVVSPERVRSYPALLAADLHQARLVILVDGRTASGAELFAQGLRLNRSADLMGSRTAGIAGLYALQRLTRKDRVLKMWIATMYDTKDRTWEGIGLEVDIGLVALGAGAPSNVIDGWVAAAMNHLAP